MSPGQVFIMHTSHRGVDDHLWVVLSDPRQNPDKILIVSITTHTPDKDQACVIQKEEFPEVLAHTSCLAFDFSTLISSKEYNTLLNAALIEIRPSVSPSLLRKMQQSVANSTDIKESYADLLIEQGLLDLDL